MRYFYDEHGSHLVARVGRTSGLDIVSSHEVGRDGVSDREQLIYAASESRCVVTQNQRDFRRLTDEFQRSATVHAGVLLMRSGPITRNHTGAIVAALVAHNAQNPDGMPPYMMDFLHF